jgi:uncharacterized repeat protein (TIGR01451 family)
MAGGHSICGALSRAFLWIMLRIAAVMTLAIATPTFAATCGPATTQGTAPPGWQTYCWLDFSTYNDTTARSTAGQTISYTLSDGSTLSFNVKATSAGTTSLTSIVAPSWTGAAVGNSAFLGIPGKPVLYTTAAGTTTLTFSNIAIAPPPGAPAVTVFSFVAADAESTDNTEALKFVTDGGGWVILDQVDPISGAQYPPITGTGTQTFTESGGGLTGNVGGYIVGSTTPSTITTTFTAGGLQGAMFAVRFASIKLSKLISGARADPADQFDFKIVGTTGGTIFGSGTTTGTSNGPFPAAVVSFSSGLPLSVSETMATGSATTLAAYRSTLTCINTNVSTTPLPTNVVTTSFNFGSLQFGDAIQCTFTNQPFPRVKLAKALAGTRVFAADQFTLNISNGATVVATATTTGTGATVATGATPSTQLTSGTAYGLNEVAAGPANLAYYAVAMACTNAAAGSTTVLPTSVPGTVTPVMGDVITCTITNAPKAATATLTLTKTSVVVSDPVNGTTNPKAIPGAIIRYTIKVTNTGIAPVDVSTIVITDPLPTTVTLSGTAPIVTYADGAPIVSGLGAAPALNATYSSQTGGGAPFSATPVLDGAGFAANIKGLRIAPSGTMAGATAAGQPSFSVSFLARIN